MCAKYGAEYVQYCWACGLLEFLFLKKAFAQLKGGF